MNQPSTSDTPASDPMSLTEGSDNNTVPESTATFPKADEPDKIEEGPEQKNDAPTMPPEEGIQGWLCVVGSLSCLFCSFGFLNAYVLPNSR